jgi:DNA-binding IscR family transcriptional regulator
VAGCLLLQDKCESHGVCRINAVWRRAEHAMLVVLRQSTLADMVEDPKRPLRPPLVKLGAAREGATKPR